MDYDSSSKFISSLAKFLQSLCNGYVEFDSGVQVIGHLYLSVDTGKTIDYILNEKVCKTDENSVTFISNSFHAQPAEKPKPPGKKLKDVDKSEYDNDSGAQIEPRSTNAGTVPSRNFSQNSPLSHSGKRPYSPSKSSPKHKRTRTESVDQNTTSHASNPASENSIASAPSPTVDGAPSDLLAAQNSDILQGSQFSETYQQSFLQPDDENSMADDSEERDIKPTIDTDVTFIKEEYAPSSSCSQSGGQGRDKNRNDDYPYSNQAYPGGYSSQGGFVASGSGSRSNFHVTGDRSHMFPQGQGSSLADGGESSGDPSATNIKPWIALRNKNKPRARQRGGYACDNCGKVYTLSHVLTRHKWKCKGLRIINCHMCSATFHRLDHLKKHMLRHGVIQI